jgi:hypothetical protein
LQSSTGLKLMPAYFVIGTAFLALISIIFLPPFKKEVMEQAEPFTATARE